MKFIVKTSPTLAPRLGTIQEFAKCPTQTLETPAAMLYTRGGSIPHITNEVFKVVCKGAHILQIPLASTYNFLDSSSEFDGDISDFVGMKESISCMTIQDPGDLTQSGHRVQDWMPLWTRSGKILINAQSYMTSVEAYKPNMYYLLSDGDTNIASSAKRASNAVKNTINYYKSCLERHKTSKVLQASFVMAAVAGGYSSKERLRCLDAITKDDIVGGYLIDGLHNNGPEVEFMQFTEMKDIVTLIIDNLPASKLRVIHGCWNPLLVIQLVQLGVDLFDTSYCHIVTERSSALTFASAYLDEAREYEINLREPQYAEDFQPILQDCTCLTCERYTRAYIHHLVTVQELLGPLLLNIHNIHHYLSFFSKIRECIREDTLEELKILISRQFTCYHEQMKNSRTN